MKNCWIIAVFLLLVAFFAVSCSDNSERGKGGDLPVFSANLIHPLATHQREQHTDDLDGITKRKYLRVLTTFNKTNFFIQKGGLYGYEYTMLKEYEKFLNRKRRRRDLNVVIEFIPVQRDMLMPSLLSGFGDIAAAGLTVTPERLIQVDFTVPYLTGIDELVVSHKRVEGLHEISDLSGRKVYVRESSSYFESLNELNRIFDEEGLKEIDIVLMDETLETEDILEMVNTGAIGITVSDSHIAELWSKFFKNIEVHNKIAVNSGREIAWMVRKENTALKTSLNDFLDKYKKGTLNGNIFFNRYFRSNKWISNPLESGGAKTHEQYTKLFKKYAARYGFDWMLIKALGFQESRLDNTKQSHTGAIGIMQVRPQTAMDKNVGIKDVHLLENNIHAGVKYLAYLRDKYFSGSELSESDRVRFSLASYNAGPGKIRKARNLANGIGLDSEKWFRNVEIAALDVIGQETVRYVSNINKYYILFRLEEQNRKDRAEAKGE